MMEQRPNERPAAGSSGPDPSPQAEPAGRDPRLDAYLEDVFNHLVGIVPRARRQELRRELALHLDCLVDACVDLGMTPEAAAEQALKRFGSARGLARQYAREYRPVMRQGPWWVMAGAMLGIFLLILLGVGAEWGMLTVGLSTLPYFAGGLLAGRLVPLRWSRPATSVLGAASSVLGVRATALTIQIVAQHLYVRGPLPDMATSGVGLAMFVFGGMMGCASHLLASWLRGALERRPTRPVTR